jgi:Kef-type K+ transport system membrane component KefB
MTSVAQPALESASLVIGTSDQQDHHSAIPSTVLLVPAAVAVAPLLASWSSRVVRIPLVVFEIVLGVVLGPAVLGRSIVGWLVALVGGLVVGVAAGAVLGNGPVEGVFVGIALTSTALGTLMPVLRDAGEMRIPFGTAVIGIGAVGEFGPLIAISLFLSGRNPGMAAVVLIVFAVVAAAAILVSARGRHRRLHAMISTTLRTSGQVAVRLVILVIAALVALSLVLGLDMLLGAFAAGMVIRLVLGGTKQEDRETVETKIEAVGFGFLVPVFFVVTGLRFDLWALTSSPGAIVLLVVVTLLILLIRGTSGLMTAPPGASAADRRAIVLLAATGLPIIVAITDIGTRSGDLPSTITSALVGAGMLTVLLFPLIALSQRRPTCSDGQASILEGDEDIPHEA